LAASLSPLARFWECERTKIAEKTAVNAFRLLLLPFATTSFCACRTWYRL